MQTIHPSAAPLASRQSADETAEETMTPFVKIEREATMRMEHRLALLQQPCEFFRQFFNGRMPSIEERARCIERMVQALTFMQIYENNIYHVEIVENQPFIHLDIRRRDRKPCKNWRHFQQIKNELVGPEHEAVELFPAESRLVDAGNQYHLWVHTKPDFRFPVGYRHRFVLEKPLMYWRYSSESDGAEHGEERSLDTDAVV